MSQPPEATPIVQVHLDEELLTRKKYLETKLQEQEKELQLNLEKEKQKLFEKRRQDELKSRKQYEDKLDVLERSLKNETKSLEDTLQSKLQTKVTEISLLSIRHQSELNSIEKQHKENEENRRISEWIVSNSPEARQFLKDEKNKRVNEIVSIHDECERSLERNKTEHIRKLASIEEDFHNSTKNWRQAKPVLVGALLGGAIAVFFSDRSFL